MNRKLESLKQYFYFLPKHSETVCGVKVFKVESFGPDTGPQSFCYLFIALSIIGCSKSAHCSGVSNRYCCYGNRAVGSKPIKKLLIISVENNSLSLPKIISKCYELVELCHINPSGPVF